jgi:hypothetical protein
MENKMLTVRMADMTLRDYFAAKAMQGFASDPDCAGGLAGIIRMAYRWADAMMEEREKGESK